MELEFVKISPTQNMTIIVLSEVARDQHVQVAKKLMSYEHIHAEQVGFLERASTKQAWAKLQMMGGEFCGNASMSLAAFLCKKRNMPVGTEVFVPIEVSGTDQISNCIVKVEDESFKSGINMPLPINFENIDLDFEGELFNVHVVYFPGITHIILEVADINKLKKEFPEAFIKIFAERFKSDAIGLLLFDKSKMYMNPLIFVVPTDTLIWERGCGSGTAAIGVYLTYIDQKCESTIYQPGGLMTVKTTLLNDVINNIYIEGTVKIVAEGIAFV